MSDENELNISNSDNEENEEESSSNSIQNADSTSNNNNIPSFSSSAVNTNSVDEFVSSLSSLTNNAEDARRITNHLQLRLPGSSNQVQVFFPQNGTVRSVSQRIVPRIHVLPSNNQYETNSSRNNHMSTQRSQLPIRSSRRFHQRHITSNPFLAQRNSIVNRSLRRNNHIQDNVINSVNSLAAHSNVYGNRLPRRVNELRQEINDPDIGLMSRIFSTNLIIERADRFRSISLGYTQASTANISNNSTITVNSSSSTPLNPNYIPRSVRPHFDQILPRPIQASNSNSLFVNSTNTHTSRPEESASSIPTLTFTNSFANWNNSAHSYNAPNRLSRLNDFTSREVTLPSYNESITTPADIEDNSLILNNESENASRFELNEGPSTSNIVPSSKEATNNNLKGKDAKEYHDSDSEDCSSSMERSVEENATTQSQFLLSDTLQERTTQNDSDEVSGRRFMMSLYLQHYLCTGHPGSKPPTEEKTSSDKDTKDPKNEKKDHDK